MRARPLARRGARRGVEAIEFAFILPLFLILVFGMFEFSWYMYLLNGTIDAARLGCKQAAVLDPDTDDLVARAEAQASLHMARNTGVDCDGGEGDCVINVYRVNTTPRRLVCEVQLDYSEIMVTGFLTAADGISIGTARWNGADAVPGTIVGRAVAVLEYGE